MSRSRKFVAAALAAVAAAALLAACGSDDGSSSSGSGSGSVAAGAEDGAFPVTIEHKYGTTEIVEPPERVVSVGFNEQDLLLALGVVPVGIRDWYGDQPYAVWPWARDALGDAEPEVLPSTEIDFEAVAALQPDLITGVSSGMTAEEYETLSQIAPTITQTDAYVDYGMPWREALLMIGTAVGKPAEAQQQIDDTEARFAEIRAAHPDWEGQEAVVSYVLSESEIGAYSSNDIRGQLMTELGLTTPPDIDELAGDQFSSSFSLEEVGRLDRDVIVWIGLDDPSVLEQVLASPLRQQLQAVAEGREVFLDEMEGGAASFSSPLSLPFLLDSLVPQIEAAIDGDPATAVPGSPAMPAG